MKIAIGSDHGGFELKEYLKTYLSKSYDVVDFGCFSLESVDYPVFAKSVAKEVSSGKASFGVLICKTGEGMCIAANKEHNVRAALVYNEEVSKLTREHNNSNIICLGASYISNEQAKKYVDIFINTPFAGGRHQRRIDLIEN